MFPTTTKDNRLRFGRPSPKAARDPNRSAYLPYFKRFPNQKFHSQERRRQPEQPQSVPRRFFSEEKEQLEKDSKPTPSRLFSNPSIKERTPGKIRPSTSVLN